ncbi:MAG: hypothetical protein AMXMBFR84_42710 [Candidatus Hydrogenedentota bacterium]
MSRIVLIDDEPVLRLTFRHILERDGHEVWDAEDGRIGVDICRAKVPDLVITDVMMPGQAGLQTVQILKREYPEMPVIVMTGGAIPKISGLGANDCAYVMKPVNGPELIKLVHSMLSHSLT